MPHDIYPCRCDASRQGGGGGGGGGAGRGVSQESGFDENTQASGSSQQTVDGGGSAASVSCKVLVRAVHSILRTLKKVLYDWPTLNVQVNA